MNTFSDRIRFMRKAKKLSQTKLAKQIGISQEFLSQIENGSRNPSIEVLEKLCDSLGCSADYLLGLLPSESSSTLEQNKLPAALTPEIVRMVEERNISENELKTAIKLTSVMREEKEDS